MMGHGPSMDEKLNEWMGSDGWTEPAAAGEEKQKDGEKAQNDGAKIPPKGRQLVNLKKNLNILMAKRDTI